MLLTSWKLARDRGGRLLCNALLTISKPSVTVGGPLFEKKGHLLRSEWLRWADARLYGQVVSFPLAQTGEGISECELMQWFVKEGDQIEEFEKLCEVQSDKAAIEITSRYTGRVKKLHWEPGSIVKVGAALVEIELPGGEGSTSDNGESSSDSSSSSLSSSSPSSDDDAEDTGRSTKDGASRGHVLAPPAVRHLARQHHVDLALVTGTGPKGRITREDVLRFLEEGPSTPAAPSGPDMSSTSMTGAPSAPFPGVILPTFVSTQGSQTSISHPSEEQRLTIKGYRRAMVKSMTEAGRVPTFHFMDEVDMGPLVRLRNHLKSDPLLQGVRLTYLPFIIKAASVAALKYPILNSSISPDQREVILHPHHNIGVAMNTAGGLVVPNIKQVESLNVLEIARELVRLQDLASSGRLATEEVTGGTMTVSNIGTVGGTYATPLVNPPEVAIVALGQSRTLPRFDHHGNVFAANIMHVSWGADHRVVDGATLAEFSNYWKSFLEEPGRFLLRVR